MIKPSQLSQPTQLSQPIICIIGAGYVGLVAACCLANSGRQVTCVQIKFHKL